MLVRRPMLARGFAAILALAALPATAQAADIADLREGSMKKLVLSEAEPAPVEIAFSDIDGGSHALSDMTGQVLLVNFWATWCAPCRKEMPALDALQAEFGGADFQVVTIATGRNPPTALRRFFEEEAIANLPLYTDPKQELARNFAVLGLPVSVLIDRQGNEIGRLVGDADWHGDSARAIVRALIEGGAEG